MIETIIINCDGSIRGGNPGGYGYSGWVAKREDGSLVQKGSTCVGTSPTMSNNVAEYYAVIHSLEYLSKDYTKHTLVVKSDSQLIINQLTGVWNCVNAQLVNLRKIALLLAQKFKGVSFVWVPREQNTEADDMSKSLQCRRKPKC